MPKKSRTKAAAGSRCALLVAFLCEQIYDAVGVTADHLAKEVEVLRQAVAAVCADAKLFAHLIGVSPAVIDVGADYQFLTRYLTNLRAEFYARATAGLWVPIVPQIPYPGFANVYLEVFGEDYAAQLPNAGAKVLVACAAVARWNRSRAHSLIASLTCLAAMARLRGEDDKTEAAISGLRAALDTLSGHYTAAHAEFALLSGDEADMDYARLVTIAERFGNSAWLDVPLTPAWRPTVVGPHRRSQELRNALDRVKLATFNRYVLR